MSNPPADQQSHFTTGANFITKMKKQVLAVFTEILLYCDEMGLIGKNMIAIDGCKLPSNASKEWNATHGSLKRKKEKMTKAVKFLLQRPCKSYGDDNYLDIREREGKYVETVERNIQKIDKFLAGNNDKIGKTGKPINSNINDNDSGKMKTSHGVIQGYYGNVAVDDLYQVIVHAQALEHDMLKLMVEGARDKLKAMGHRGDALEQTQLTDHDGFNGEKNLEMIYSDGIGALIADKQPRERDTKFADAQKSKERPQRERAERQDCRKSFSTSDFKFADGLSHCICTAGQRLYRNGGDIFNQGRHNVRFKGSKSSCLPCKLRSNCLRHPKRKQTRAVAYFTGRTKGAKIGYTQTMKDKIDSETGRSIYSKRIGAVEPVFANKRLFLKLSRFTLLSAPKVNIQWHLYSIVHNMP